MSFTQKLILISEKMSKIINVCKITKQLPENARSRASQPTYSSALSN